MAAQHAESVWSCLYADYWKLAVLIRFLCVQVAKQQKEEVNDELSTFSNNDLSSV